MNEVSLFIVNTDNIKGFWPLEMASKYDVGYFRKISFKTYCSLTGSLIPAYVILEQDPVTGNFYEFLTGEQVYSDNNDFRSFKPCESNFCPCLENLDGLKEASLLEIGKIFDNLETAKVKQLFKDFCQENKMAFYETEDLYNRDLRLNYYDNFPNTFSYINDEEALKKGFDIFNNLIELRMAQEQKNAGLKKAKYKQYKIQVFSNKN